MMISDGQTWRRLLGAFLAGLVGCALTLGVWRLANDYADFLKMRLWIAQVQAAQAQQAAPAAPK